MQQSDRNLLHYQTLPFLWQKHIICIYLLHFQTWNGCLLIIFMKFIFFLSIYQNYFSISQQCNLIFLFWQRMGEQYFQSCVSRRTQAKHLGLMKQGMKFLFSNCFQKQKMKRIQRLSRDNCIPYLEIGVYKKVLFKLHRLD